MEWVHSFTYLSPIKVAFPPGVEELAALAVATWNENSLAEHVILKDTDLSDYPFLDSRRVADLRVCELSIKNLGFARNFLEPGRGAFLRGKSDRIQTNYSHFRHLIQRFYLATRKPLSIFTRCT